jgi:replicative DNA helicase
MQETRAPFIAAFEQLSNLEVEQAFLGAAFAENRIFQSQGHLRPDAFTDSAHGDIWAMGRKMVDEGHEATPATLAGRIQDVDSGFLAHIAASMVNTLNAPSYAEQIADLANRRALVTSVEYALEGVTDFDRPGDEILSGVVSELQTIIGAGSRRAISKRDVARAMLGGIDEDLPCYPTGLAGLDKAMGGGLFAGKLYGLAARKKVGKTILLGSVSHNLNQAGTKHLFITLEMSPEEIEQRNAGREQGFNSIKFLTRDDAGLPDRVSAYVGGIKNYTIYEHAPGASLDQVRGMVARAITGAGIKGVILDYLQLVGGKERNETEEYHLRSVAQWLADICRKEGIFALTAAQVNQDGNTRGGEGPHCTGTRSKAHVGHILSVAPVRHLEERRAHPPPTSDTIMRRPYQHRADLGDNHETGQDERKPGETHPRN